MKVKIYNSVLRGCVKIPPSKSFLIRAIVCAGLSNGVSNISGFLNSDDVMAAINAITALGAKVNYFKYDNSDELNLKILGTNYNFLDKIQIDCKESATVFRFFLSIVATLGLETKFILNPSLVKRDSSDLINLLIKHGISYDNHLFNDGYLISKGKLSIEDFFIKADVSSQYISSLLIALPLVNSPIKNYIKLYMISNLVSKQYVDMTIDTLSKFGVNIKSIKNQFIIDINQKFKNTSINIEGDFSIGANFLVAKAINSPGIIVENLLKNSLQGDKIILDIINQVNLSESIQLDANNFIDLVPILAVLFICKNINARVYNIRRLTLKESNRLEAICKSLKKIGARINYNGNELYFNGRGKLNGGVLLNGYNDHRIVMALAILGLNCENPIFISDAQAVNKSFPDFWKVFKSLGANIEFLQD